MINQSNFWYCIEFLYMRIFLGRESGSGNDCGALSHWQVAKDLGLRSMVMSCRGAFDFGFAGATAAVVQPMPAQPAPRAVIVSTLDFGAANAAALKLDSRAGASALRPGRAFAMTSQAGGT